MVVDASVVANAVADDDADGDLARSRLSTDGDLHAPQLLDVEVVSTLRGRWLGGHLDDRRVDEALGDLAQLSITRYPHRAFLRRLWGLRDNLTPYDAAYVALAEALGCTLVTADGRIARAPGTRCHVDVLKS